MNLGYVVIFLALVAQALFWAFQVEHWITRAILINVGVSFGLLAAAYSGAGPALLLKRRDGRLRLIAWLIYWPLFLLNGVSFICFGLVSSERDYDQIVPGLYLGRRLTQREARNAAELAKAAVLDTTSEFTEPPEFRKRENYLLLPVLDRITPTVEQLQIAVDWIDQHIAQGPVYVHCALGHGRSATVVIAYLLLSETCGTVKEALQFVKDRRENIKLHPEHIDTLEEFLGASRQDQQA